MVFLTIFHKLVKLQSLERLNLCVSDVIHTNEQSKYVNCGLHVSLWNFFVNVILFYDEKGLF